MIDFKKAFLTGGLLLFLAGNISPAAADTAVQQALSLGANGEYIQAHQMLDTQAQNYAARLARARLYSWQGEQEKAQDILNLMSAKEQENPDTQVLQAYLYYHRGEFDKAAALFKQVTDNYPDYTDAQEGLVRAEAARLNQLTTDGTRWRLDTGGNHSHFTRVPQADWNETYLQLGYQPQGGQTNFFGRIARYDRFENIDSEYDLGLYHSFSDLLIGYVQTGFAPNADFRPHWRFLTGGEARLFQSRNNAQNHALNLWALTDLKYETYGAEKIYSFAPGLRLSPYDGWSATAKSIIVDGNIQDPTFGYNLRLDGRLHPQLRFYAGHSDAPETVAGDVVDTTSYYGGLFFDVSDRHSVTVGYSHEDREESWKRNVINAGITLRF